MTQVKRDGKMIDLKTLTPLQLRKTFNAIDAFVEHSGNTSVAAAFVNTLEWALREKVVYIRKGKYVVNGRRKK